jgi:hypothetical protein
MKPPTIFCLALLGALVLVGAQESGLSLIKVGSTSAILRLVFQLIRLPSLFVLNIWAVLVPTCTDQANACSCP